MLTCVRPPRPIDLPQDRYRLNQIRRSPLLKLGDSPGKAIILRIMFAVGLLLIVTMITWIDGANYSDSQGDSPLTFVDALYYSTVTVTTTGYGDIVPATQGARLLTTIVVTPIRVLFLILLVGTTLQLLAGQSLFNKRRRKWQEGLSEHTVICGFGIKGRSALLYLSNHDPDGLVVAIDKSEEALEIANQEGAGGVLGSSLESDVLRAAGIESAAKVIVALNSDDDAVVTVLRIKELNPSVKVVASCREQKNEALLLSSGAEEVIVSASSAGRILGMAAQAPDAARIVNDLLTFGDGLDINERIVATPGGSLEVESDQTAIAVIRAGTVLRPGAEQTLPLQAGDRVIYIDSNMGDQGRPAES